MEENNKEKILELSTKFSKIKNELNKVIVGQDNLIQGLLMSLLCNGHILLEGMPGLAKTLSAKTLAEIIHLDFKRVQFTPDLLPSDLIGTTIYDQKNNDFLIKKGPIFTNFLLADEINRAPSKVQSALLEAMQEKQVTISHDTFSLPEVFLVLATQNPIEQEGTYPLPEAQLDRFMLKINIKYPSKAEELKIINMHENPEKYSQNIFKEELILEARNIVKNVYLDDRIKKYIVDLVFATRFPKDYNLDIEDLITHGASPRASIYFITCAKAYAFLQQREYVIPEDIKIIANAILNHRILLSYEAIANDVKQEDIIKALIEKIKVP